ncbi:MAG: entericidin A/B family lipoprotein [Alphaproteobacteria bacterium]|nr:entericidin A/B family lipoprotein [Alphaproteobacteria bacterium]MCK5518119.1 entericidin A/B family lipoprotein [Alphaproteobacteria bacterium]MCK5658593.1 entericidin A/B family lipoprotein [Alphaproteobacteria bacterium]
MAKKSIHVLFCMIVLVFLTGGLSACNTFEGIGRDMKSAGEAVTDAAQ